MMAPSSFKAAIRAWTDTTRLTLRSDRDLSRA